MREDFRVRKGSVVRLYGASVKLLVLLLLLLMTISAMLQLPLAFATGSPRGSSTALLTEWVVPTPQSGPSALALDESGRCCWFLEYYGNKIGHFDSSSGTFQEWQLPIANANPFDLAVSNVEGSTVIWGTEIGLDRVFVFWPETGILREYSLPHSGSGVAYISVEPTTSSEVRVWFTEATANRNGEFIYDPTTSNVTLYEDSFPAAVGGGALGVYATPNSIWFAGFSAVVRWDRASQQYTMYPLPNHGLAVGRSIGLDSQGNVWYTQGVENGTSGNNYLGVLRGNTFMEGWQISTLGSDPGSISINPITQQPWVIEQSRQVGNGAVAVLDNSTGAQIVLTTVSTAPSGGAPVVLGAKPESLIPTTSIVTPATSPFAGSWNGPFAEFPLASGSQPRDVVVDSTGTVWITEPGSNKIARISEPNPDFVLSVAPSLLTLSHGGSGTVAVSGVSISGFAGPLALTATSAPAGVSFSAFNSILLNVPSGGNATSGLVISVAPNAANGTSLILIDASNGTLTHTASIILTIAPAGAAPTPQCLITAAMLGSQLNPEVQSLRDFRDNRVQATKVGASFMIVFNAWYYSFSPYVAHYISNRDPARSGMRVLLYPLIGVFCLAFGVYSEIAFYPEFAVLTAGLLASSILGAIYVGLPVGILGRRLHKTLCGTGLKATGGFLLLFGLLGVLAGLALSSGPLLMFSTSLTVLSSAFESAVLTADLLSGGRSILNYFHLLNAAASPARVSRYPFGVQRVTKCRKS